MFLRILFSLFLVIFCSIELSAQKVVVSEYYNESSNPANEWTELLVIADNTSMVGYKLRDNAGTSGLINWQGGVEFNNVPLWQNLRAGTIIIIRHRGTMAVDDKKEDGYIEIGAENKTYFSEKCYGCTLNWSSSALNIAQESEIIQLLNAADQPEHTLAHMPAITGDFPGITGAKISSKGNVPDGGSCRVVPGASLADYNRGFDANDSYTARGSVSEENIKGLPNFRQSSMDENSNFWRSLRQPTWSSPNLVAVKNGKFVDLKWNAAQFDVDNTQGYLVVVYQSSDLTSNDPNNLPIDGKIYKVGDIIGAGKVVAQTASNITEAKASVLDLQCGIESTYRVYAFRYKKDDFAKDDSPKNGRGRSYNEVEFASSKILVSAPKAPNLASTNGKAKICEGESITIKGYSSEIIASRKWYFQDLNSPIANSNSDSITVSKAGKYFYEIETDDACKIASQAFVLEVVPRPTANLFMNGILLKSDTTVVLCKGNNVLLECNDGQTRSWFKDDIDLGVSTPSQTVKSKGVYYIKTSNQGLCDGISYKVKIQNPDVNYTLSPNPMNVGEIETYEERDLTITNISSEDLKLSNVILPNDIKILGDLNTIITNGKPLVVKVRISPTNYGKFKDSVKFEAPCNTFRTLVVNADKPLKYLISNGPINFDTLKSCDTKPVSKKLKIKSIGLDAYTILSPITSPEFSISGINFNYSIKSMDSVECDVVFNPTNDGIYKSTIKFPYTSDNITFDTLKVAVLGEYLVPSAEILPINMDFPKITDCIASLDTFIIIKNTGRVDLVLGNISDSRIQILNSLKTIYVGETDTLKFRYLPSQNIENFDLNLNFAPCNLNFAIPIKAQKDGYVVTFDKNKLDFGIVNDCAYPSGKKDSLLINVNGISSTNLIVNAIKLPNAFKTNLKIGDSFSPGNNQIYITFDANKANEMSGDLEITLAPCNSTYKIPLSGNWKTLSYTIVDTLRFGSLSVNESNIMSSMIVNNGSAQIILGGISLTKTPFSIKDGEITSPVPLDNGVAHGINFEYKAIVPNKDDTLIVYLQVLEPCKFDIPIVLIGDSRKVLDTLLFEFADTTRIIPGEMAFVSLKVKEITNFNLKDIKMKGLNFTFSYNPTVVEPLYKDINKLIYYSNEIKQNDVISTAVSTTQNANEFLVELEFAKDISINSGELFQLRMDTFLSDSIFSSINLNDAKLISNKQFNYKIEGGLIELSDICIKNLRLIKFGTFAQVFDVYQSSNQLTFIYEVVSQNLLQVNLTDLNGNIIKEIVNGSLKSGVYEIDLNKNDFPSGVYLATYRTDDMLITRKILIQK